MKNMKQIIMLYLSDIIVFHSSGGVDSEYFKFQKTGWFYNVE